jgi:hypothetical protein
MASKLSVSEPYVRRPRQDDGQAGSLIAFPTPANAAPIGPLKPSSHTGFARRTEIEAQNETESTQKFHGRAVVSAGTWNLIDVIP